MSALAAQIDWYTNSYPSYGVASADPEEYSCERARWGSEHNPRKIYPVPNKAVVVEMKDDHCRLRTPITISITWEEQYLIVENESLGHYGVGPNLEEAVKVMFHSMCVVYSSYRDTPVELLDSGAKELLAKHENVLEWIG